jgi:hypothetical protein
MEAKTEDDITTLIAFRDLWLFSAGAVPKHDPEE